VDVDARSSGDGLRDGDAAANADAISLRPRPRAESLWARSGCGAGDDALYAHPAPGADAAAGIKRTSKRRGAQHSTDDLLVRAAQGRRSSRMSALRTSHGAPPLPIGGEANVETDQERHA
jgi:hypothetical protein